MRICRIPQNILVEVEPNRVSPRHRNPLSYVHSFCLFTFYERATPVARERNPTAPIRRHADTIFRRASTKNTCALTADAEKSMYGRICYGNIIRFWSGDRSAIREGGYACSRYRSSYREADATETRVWRFDFAGGTGCARSASGRVHCRRVAPAEFSAIDVLVNNAGLSLNLEPAYKVPIEDWETMVDTNIKGLLYCTRLVLPGMVARGRGHVVNIGSVAAMYAYPGGNVYGATKAFVKQFSHNLRADLLGTAVRVTDIEPGLAETEFSVVRFKGDEQRAASIYKGTQPLTAEDIADAVHWVVTRPAHVNIDTISMMPVCQAFSPLAIYRQ